MPDEIDGPCCQDNGCRWRVKGKYGIDPNEIEVALLMESMELQMSAGMLPPAGTRGGGGALEWWAGR